MNKHRVSYLKTIFVSSSATLIAGVGLVRLFHSAWLGGVAWSAPRQLVCAALAVVLCGVEGVAGAVVSGGLIALRRDTLQGRGLPYVSGARREWLPGATVGMSRRLIRTVRKLLDRTPGRLWLRPGEFVEIRSLAEILATLDERGRLDSLPFMPEMAALCGQQARVLRRVAKIHDYVARTGLRRMHDTVLLERLLCDGSTHGGCQASCHLLWKEAWLKRSPRQPRSARFAADPLHAAFVSDHAAQGPEFLVQLARRVENDGTTRYVCQMTQVADGTSPLAWGDPRHYAWDLLAGNVRLGPFLVGVSIALFNWAQTKRGGAESPGRVVNSRKTSPHETLDLRPGERVRVKPLADIEATLTNSSRNRGLWFDGDLIRYCGGEYRVLARIHRLVDPQTGKLVTLATPGVILDGVTATGEYLAFCPQNDPIFWREIWLERVPETLEEYLTRIHSSWQRVPAQRTEAAHSTVQ